MKSQVFFISHEENLIGAKFRFFWTTNYNFEVFIPKGASSAAVLAGAVEMKDGRAHKATVPACAPVAHWEGAGQKAQSLTTAKLEREHYNRYSH